MGKLESEILNMELFFTPLHSSHDLAHVQTAVVFIVKPWKLQSETNWESRISSGYIYKTVSQIFVMQDLRCRCFCV